MHSSDNLKIAFVGGGINSAIGNSHLSAVSMDKRWEIHPSYFSTDPLINDETHRKWGIPINNVHQSYADYLLQKSDIDLLGVLTPSPLHAELIEFCIKNSIAVLTEKPICCNLTEMRGLLTLLNQYPEAYVRYVHNYSHYPMFKELEILTKQGNIGRIKHIRIDMPSDGYAREELTGLPQAWRQVDGEIPMLLLDLMTHMYHLCHRLVGHSSGEVISSCDNITTSMNVVDNCLAQIRRDDGVLIDLWCSKAHLGIKNGLNISVFGESGSMTWNQTNPDQLTCSDMQSNVLIKNRGSISQEARNFERFKPGHPTGFIEAFANFYLDLADDIERNATNKSPNKWISTLHDAANGIVVIDAITRSSIAKNAIRYECI
jgi:predicted dehydrogenase